MYLWPLPVEDGKDRTWSEANEMVCLEDDNLTPHLWSALKYLIGQVGLVTGHTENPIEVSGLDQCSVGTLELANLSVVLGQSDVLEEYVDGWWVERTIFLIGIEDVKYTNGCTCATGFTALYKAAGEASPSIISLLMRHGAEPNTEPKSSRTALVEAALWGRLDNVKELLAGGADSNIWCSRGGKKPRAVDFARPRDDNVRER
ncbi:hypothetical protein PspLS_06231 [Pyricularia sp. CBS 133598]|nr:hypothetical protein PspLS_06231 [Pyricularia sp. CBS 133598]